MTGNNGCGCSNDKRIKVLHVIGGGEIGGAEKHVLTLLKNMDRSLYDPLLLCLCSGPFRPLAEENGIRAWEIPMRHKLDYGKIKKVCEFINTHQIDIVHTHGVRANMIARRAAWLCHAGIVTTFHSMLRYDYRHYYQYMMAKMLIKPGNKYTDRYIAVSGAVAEDMTALGIRAGGIDTVYNALEIDKLPEGYSRNALLQEFSWPDDALIVGTVARLHKVKGHVYLVRAAAKLTGTLKNIYFLFIGEGQERESIQQEIASYGLENRIILAGFKPEAARYCSGFDIFCLPSLMEGMGLAILEAMHYGTPVLATDVGGIGEIITGGENGLLVPARDADALAAGIASLARDAVLRDALGISGQARTESFTLNAMLQATQKIYAEVYDAKQLRQKASAKKQGS